MKKTVYKVLTAAVIAVFASACLTGTQNTVKEYDASGNLIKETVTSESVVKTITSSTAGKTVIMYDNSFLAFLTASTATAEDPTPTLKMGVGKADRGLVTIAEKHNITCAPLIIEAARAGDLSLTAIGISSGSAATSASEAADTASGTAQE